MEKERKRMEVEVEVEVEIGIKRIHQCETIILFQRRSDKLRNKVTAALRGLFVFRSFTERRGKK